MPDEDAGGGAKAGRYTGVMPYWLGNGASMCSSMRLASSELQHARSKRPAPLIPPHANSATPLVGQAGNMGQYGAQVGHKVGHIVA